MIHSKHYVLISQYSRSIATTTTNNPNIGISTLQRPHGYRRGMRTILPPARCTGILHLLARRHEVLLQQVGVVRLGDRNAGVPETLRQLGDVAARLQPRRAESVERACGVRGATFARAVPSASRELLVAIERVRPTVVILRARSRGLRSVRASRHSHLQRQRGRRELSACQRADGHRPAEPLSSS